MRRQTGRYAGIAGLLLGLLPLLVSWGPMTIGGGVPPVAAIVDTMAVYRLAATSGTQDLTVPGVTWMPGAAIVLVTNATADNTATTHAIFGVGFTDCTNQRAFGIYAEDGGATQTDSNARGMIDELVVLLDTTAAVDGEANINQCIAGGIRVDWGNAPAAGYLVHLLVFNAAYLSNAFVSHYASNAVVGNATDVTPGFEPHVVFVAGFRDEFDDASVGGPAGFCFGVAHNDVGTDTQVSVGWKSRATVTTTELFSATSALYACRMSCTTGASCVSAQLGSYNAAGFSATTQLEGRTDDFMYLAMRFSGPAQYVDIVNSRTSNGTEAYAPGFQPAGGIFFQSGAAGTDSGEADIDASYLGFLLFDRTRAYNVTWRDTDNVAFSVTGRADTLVDDALNLRSSAGTLFTGTVATDTDSVNITFTATDGTVRKWGLFVLEVQ